MIKANQLFTVRNVSVKEKEVSQVRDRNPFSESFPKLKQLTPKVILELNFEWINK